MQDIGLSCILMHYALMQDKRLRGGQLFLAFKCPEGPTVGLSFCLRQLESRQDRRLESFFPSLTEY